MICLDTRLGEHRRVPRLGLASLPPELSLPNFSLGRSFDKLDQEVTAWIQYAKLAT